MPPLVLPSVWGSVPCVPIGTSFLLVDGCGGPRVKARASRVPARPSASNERRFGRRTAARTRASVESALAGPRRARRLDARAAVLGRGRSRARKGTSRRRKCAGPSGPIARDRGGGPLAAVGCSPMGRPLHFRGSASGRSSRGPFPPTMATQPRSMLREYFEALVVAGLFLGFTNTFAVKTFYIPSGSMEDTLLIGDHLFVNRFIYGPTPTSIEKALLPSREIHHGDIVIFRSPETPRSRPGQALHRHAGRPGRGGRQGALPQRQEGRRRRLHQPSRPARSTRAGRG